MRIYICSRSPLSATSSMRWVTFLAQYLWLTAELPQNNNECRISHVTMKHHSEMRSGVTKDWKGWSWILSWLLPGLPSTIHINVRPVFGVLPCLASLWVLEEKDSLGQQFVASTHYALLAHVPSWALAWYCYIFRTAWALKHVKTLMMEIVSEMVAYLQLTRLSAR